MRLISRNHWLFSAFLTAAFSATAQDFPVDVALSASFSSPLPWVVGTTQTLSLDMRNLSTRTTRGQIRQTGFGPIDFTLPIDLFTFVGESCGRNVDCEQFGVFCYDSPTIAANGSASCTRTLRSEQIRGRRISVTYTYQDLVFNHFEPNLSNNSVDVRITLIEPPVVQVPLSPWSYGLISLLMIGCGAIAARRWG